MARYDLKVLKISRVARNLPHCFRYRLRDEALKTSLKHLGILMPVIVTNTDRPVLITGHKRFYAAQALKIKEMPALIAGAVKPKDAFLLNLVSNWTQGCSEMDRARVLGMAVQKFHFKESEILSIVMPLLGLSEDRALLEFYRKVDQCPASFKDLVEDGQLPLRSIVSFLKLSEKDQDYFAKNIGTQMKLTSSQLLQTGEWLSDIVKGTGKGLKKLCEEHGILAKLGRRGMDPRMKADRFFARVKELRFPTQSHYLKVFGERRVQILHDAAEFRVEPIQGFEEPGFELHARVKTPGELERLLRKLSLKSPLLNSLFEIAL
jgi:hypothetical protein